MADTIDNNQKNGSTELDSQGQEDFAKLLEESESARESKIHRDRKIRGTVVSVGEEWVFVDVGAKSEGYIARAELSDEEAGTTVKPGDTIEAYVVKATGSDIVLSVKMTSAASKEALFDAYKSGVPVEGLVLEEKKGGFSVRILGKETFCPYSQIDMQRISSAEDYIGKRFSFRIIEHKEGGGNIVVSRRIILEEEKAEDLAKLKETLKQGDLIEGRVTNLVQFGAFVDIGGIEGLIPMSEMAWRRVENASDLFTPGDQVKVEILKIDWDNERITLSAKGATEDPWESIAETYELEKVYNGVVKKLMDFGAFVELTPGVEGLIHISNMGAGRRINHPREVLSVGEEVQAKILSVDKDKRRIGLELVSSAQAPQIDHVELNAGDRVQGTVETIKDYGLFVGLPGGKTGLLHVSEIPAAGGQNPRANFKIGDSVQVEILAIDPDSEKISLSVRSLEDKAERDMVKEFSSKESSEKSMGTLGDLLKDKLGT